MRDSWSHDSGLQMEPMALPATGDVVEVFGTRMSRISRPTLPGRVRRIDAQHLFRAVEVECDRWMRRVVVGVLISVVGVAGWLASNDGTTPVPTATATAAVDR